MARTFTVAELATKIRDRGDFNESPYITDAFLIDALDSAKAEVYDIVVSKFEDAYTTISGLSATAGDPDVSLPTNFYKLIGVDLDAGGGQFSTVHRWNLHERNLFDGTLGGSSYRYRLVGSELRLIPTPASDEDFRVWYVPISTRLTRMEDEVDGINGFEELMVAIAQRKCHVREGTSVTAIDAEIERQTRRIEIMAGGRDAGEPESLQDICCGNSTWDDL